MQRMRSPLDASTLLLAAIALVMAAAAYLKDPGLPVLGAKAGFSVLALVLPRMVVALLPAGPIQGLAVPVIAGWLVSVFNSE
ncbi:MAG: hypothetical protein DME04_08820 [Candidatus Rokuibacteriota bacterium]|nr:MAG: hypothetical protein DME04_08820 [Candidatus Rokubacteria bacterium]